MRTHLLVLVGLLACASASAARPAPCQLEVRKEALAAAVGPAETASASLRAVEQRAEAFAGLEYQRACAPVVVRYLLSSDAVERVAGAVYSQLFMALGTTEWHIPVLSDFFGSLTVARHQRYFPFTAAQLDRLVAAAPSERHPLVLQEQLRHLQALGGMPRCLEFLRAAEKGVQADAELRREALWLWRNDAPLRLLSPAEREAAFADALPRAGHGGPPSAVDRSPERRAAVEARLGELAPGAFERDLFRAASEVGLGDRVSGAIVEHATRTLEKNKNNCFWLGPYVVAATGHAPTVRALVTLFERCESAFAVRGELVRALAVTPDPEGDLLAALPLLARLRAGMCPVANELVANLPASARPATYIAFAKAFNGGGLDAQGDKEFCLWKSAPEIIRRLGESVVADDTARRDEAVEALVGLGEQLARVPGGSELWRSGGALVLTLARAKTERASIAIVEIARGETRRRHGNLPFAREAEAAVYLAGGPGAEKRAAQVRRHR